MSAHPPADPPLVSSAGPEAVVSGRPYPGAVADPRAVAGAVAAGRIALGALLVLAPQRAATAWLGRDGARPAVRVLATGLGARDVTIGVGTAWALAQGFGAGAWLRAGAVADALDLLAMFRARRVLPPVRGAGAMATAATGVLTGAWLVRELD